MLSDEEKEAIETIKKYEKIDIFDFELYYFELKQASKTILNLIEKQSKEIEELKEDNKKKSIVIIEYQDLYEKLVDKIKAKIEELEKLDFGTDLVSQFTANLTTITILQSLLEKE